MLKRTANDNGTFGRCSCGRVADFREGDTVVIVCAASLAYIGKVCVVTRVGTTQIRVVAANNGLWREWVFPAQLTKLHKTKLAGAPE
jgi:hypothetical protein